jgi:hypothetical protein
LRVGAEKRIDLDSSGADSGQQVDQNHDAAEPRADVDKHVGVGQRNVIGEIEDDPRRSWLVVDHLRIRKLAEVGVRLEPKNSVHDDVEAIETDVGPIGLVRPIRRESIELVAQCAPREASGQQVAAETLEEERVDRFQLVAKRVGADLERPGFPVSGPPGDFVNQACEIDRPGSVADSLGV